MHFSTPKISRITQPVLDCIFDYRPGEYVVLEGRSLELMYAIQKELDIFEPTGDNESRLLWLEIPMGTEKEWKNSFAGKDPTDGERWKFLNVYPRETQWVFLSTCTYGECTTLHVSCRDYRFRTYCSEKFCPDGVWEDMVWFLEPLLALVRERVAKIAENPEDYNRYLERNLPFCQRSGRIRSREFNRIYGPYLKVKNHALHMKLMKELIRWEAVYKGKDTDWQNLGVPEPLGEMTIRTFCRYYRIAHTVFKNYPVPIPKTRTRQDDVEYYSSNGLYNDLEEYDLDSQADFVRFARNRYGDLSLTGINVVASNCHVRDKWIITLSCGRSGCLDIGLEIALALYKSGVPFIFCEAGNALGALEQTGWIYLESGIFHDFFKGNDDTGNYCLPYVEDCGQPFTVSRAQYDEMVRLARWKPTCSLQPDNAVPLEFPFYDSIREQADGPLTVSQIRRLIEQKYGVRLTVAEDDDGRYFRQPLQYKGETIEIPGKKYYRTFNEAMSGLILFFNGVVRNGIPAQDTLTPGVSV